MDLGCSPGSWLIYSSKIVGISGLVVGVDIKNVEIFLPKNVFVFVKDIYGFASNLFEDVDFGFDVVVSDVAPSPSGNTRTDMVRSFELSSKALEVASKVLISGGFFVCKVFQGMDLRMFISLMEKQYMKHVVYKPKSTRKSSREVYIIGLNKIVGLK